MIIPKVALQVNGGCIQTRTFDSGQILCAINRGEIKAELVYIMYYVNMFPASHLWPGLLFDPPGILPDAVFK